MLVPHVIKVKKMNSVGSSQNLSSLWCKRHKDDYIFLLLLLKDA